MGADDFEGAAAHKGLIIDGASFSTVLPLLSTELLIVLFYTFAGYLLFRWFELQAKRRGTLEAF